MINLTEQWKKGELPNGWYWVEGSRAEGIYAYTAEYLNNMYRPQNSERIIEQVPSYELWKAVHEQWKVLLEENAQLKKWCEEFNALEVAKENTKLKELLKRARNLMNYTKDWACSDATEEMIAKINQVLGEE